jgi:hypothetical protein
MAKKNLVKVCPVCGSVNVDFTNYGLYNVDNCRDCGFQRPFSSNKNYKIKVMIREFPKIGIDKVADFQKKIKKNKATTP